MRVTVKELVRWLDSFGLPSTPWAAEPADWATALNLLARLLHPTLAQRVEEATKSLEEASEPEESAEEGQKEAREDHQQLLRRQSQQTHPSTQLALQEALEMAERVLGIPQFSVVADLKRGPAENQLALFVTLCALHFAMGPADTKPFRDFQFTFRIYFDMDADGSRRECTACGQLVHLIERLVLNGHVWHRACLKCALCGRQLYRGAFHWLNLGGDSFRLECVEHRANAVLFGDPKQRLAAIPPLPPPSSMSVSQHSALSQQPPEKRASLVSSVHSPPPRPPPPRMVASAISSTQKQQTEEEKADEDEEESIERKIALAAAARHDAPVPRPRQSLLNKQPKPPEKKTGEKTSWEVLEYPEELNPFGSEEEEEEMEEEGSLQSRRRRPHSKDAAANPFETDSEEEEGIVQVDNPQDRVLASPKPSTTGDSAPGSSGCPSPLGQQQNHPAMVQLVQPVGKQEPGPQPSSAAAIDAKMPEPATSCYAESEEEQQPNCWQFVPPLGPMPFRLGQEKPGKASPAPQPTAATSTPSEQQHQMHELDTKLRRLHAQLDQWEITGARLEGQMLRELLATQKDSQQQQLHQMHVWRKGNKLANEFAQLVEQRCAALATEAVLVRRYVDHFLALAHAELDRQMREQLQLGGTKDEARKRQFNDLLAQLLHIRNELTELESRERQAKAAKATPPNPTAEKTAKAEAKKEAKKEKEEQQQKAEPLKKKKSAETASEESGGGGAEGVGEEKKKSAAAKSKPKGDKEETTKEKEGKGRLLKNTLKNLKKKL